MFRSTAILIKIDGALVLNKSVVNKLFLFNYYFFFKYFYQNRIVICCFRKKVRFNCPQSEGFFPADDLCTGNYIVCVEGVAYPEVRICIIIV